MFVAKHNDMEKDMDDKSLELKKMQMFIFVNGIETRQTLLVLQNVKNEMCLSIISFTQHKKTQSVVTISVRKIVVHVQVRLGLRFFHRPIAFHQYPYFNSQLQLLPFTVPLGVGIMMPRPLWLRALCPMVLRVCKKCTAKEIPTLALSTGSNSTM